VRDYDAYTSMRLGCASAAIVRRGIGDSASKPSFSRLSPQGILEAPLSLILNCLSRPLWAALCLAVSYSGRADPARWAAREEV
jgi:hypothetical protein